MTTQLPKNEKLSFESDRWDEFQAGRVSMTVPMRFSSMTVNKNGIVWRKTQLVAEMEDIGAISLYRENHQNIQIYDADQPDKHRRFALNQPLSELVLRRVDNLWTAEIDPRIIAEEEILMGFIRIAATFAVKKQRASNT